MTEKEKAELLDKVDGKKIKYLKTDKWMIIDREYFDEFPDMIEVFSKRGYRISDLKKIVWEYQYGEVVPVRLLHQQIVEALFERRITSENMKDFIDIIRECKWLEPSEYEKLVEVKND